MVRTGCETNPSLASALNISQLCCIGIVRLDLSAPVRFTSIWTLPFPLLAVALTVAVPALEGWWPPGGPDPHPSALTEDVRERVASAVVFLGADRSGAFVTRSGLVLTSATAVQTCVEALQASGVFIDAGPFVASDRDEAPVCPGLRARFRIDARDVSLAVNAARRAGSTQVEAALISACERLSTQRSCEVVSTEEGIHRLIARREVGPVRLRFWPGRELFPVELGPEIHDHPPPRLDVALLSVDLGRAGVPGFLALAQGQPKPDDELWLWHHPAPSLRWSSALEVEIFAHRVLPTYRRSAPEHRRASLDLLAREAPAALRAARRVELQVLEQIRRLAPERRGRLSRAFVRGRSAFRQAPWETWSRLGALGPSRAPLFPAWSSEPSAHKEPLQLPKEVRVFAAGAATRRQARLVTGHPAIGPDGGGDLRVSRGRVQSDGALSADVLRASAAKRGADQAAVEGLIGRRTVLTAFEAQADIGPLASGGPVVDERGMLVGVISLGNAATVAGHFAFREDARVRVTLVSELLRMLKRGPAGAGGR